MELEIASWLNMALRWLHIITGIAWIGSSFYFIWLDNSLRAPTDKKDKDLGVGGELWAVHGGGFYHKKKYQVAPSHMPDDLHWFKWEAYFTWMSGFFLLALMYYYGAHQFLIDTSKLPLERWQATGIGLAALLGGWIFYNRLCKSPIGKNNGLFGWIWFGVLVLAGWGLTQIFSDRGAFIHIGAIVGTVMAANVFMIIIPNQKKVVASLLAGEKPDPALGLMAKQRSLHNNYMTLPVLLLMVSNHYPVLFGHEYNWLLLAGVSAAAWPIRHYFNLKHKGKDEVMWLAAGMAGFVLVMVLAAELKPKAVEMAGGGVSDAEVRQIVRTHCSSCHSDVPTDENYSEAPMGVRFDTMEEIRIHAQQIKAQAVDSDIMPLGNMTEMTDEERAKLGAWVGGLK